MRFLTDAEIEMVARLRRAASHLFNPNGVTNGQLLGLVDYCKKLKPRKKRKKRR